jgi:hypothetical protein
LANHNITKNATKERTEYLQAEKEIMLLHRAIDDINLKTALAKDNSQNLEDQLRLEAYKNHKIDAIKIYIKQLRLLQHHLYHDYKLWEWGHGIEYGYNEYFSYGMNGNFSKAKSREDTNIGLFVKYKMLHHGNYIVTLKPNFHFGKMSNIMGVDIIFGTSKKIKPKKNKLETEIFHYDSIGITKHIDQYKATNNIGYSFETCTGVKLKTNILLITQTINQLNPESIGLYRNIFRKQFKIAKEIEINSSKLSLSVGYFTINSLSAKKYIGAGYMVGIWIEI